MFPLSFLLVILIKHGPLVGERGKAGTGRRFCAQAPGFLWVTLTPTLRFLSFSAFVEICSLAIATVSSWGLVLSRQSKCTGVGGFKGVWTTEALLSPGADTQPGEERRLLYAPSFVFYRRLISSVGKHPPPSRGSRSCGSHGSHYGSKHLKSQMPPFFSTPPHHLNSWDIRAHPVHSYLDAWFCHILLWFSLTTPGGRFAGESWKTKNV